MTIGAWKWKEEVDSCSQTFFATLVSDHLQSFATTEATSIQQSKEEPSIFPLQCKKKSRQHDNAFVPWSQKCSANAPVIAFKVKEATKSLRFFREGRNHLSHHLQPWDFLLTSAQVEMGHCSQQWDKELALIDWNALLRVVIKVPLCFFLKVCFSSKPFGIVKKCILCWLEKWTSTFIDAQWKIPRLINWFCLIVLGLSFHKYSLVWKCFTRSSDNLAVVWHKVSWVGDKWLLLQNVPDLRLWQSERYQKGELYKLSLPMYFIFNFWS